MNSIPIKKRLIELLVDYFFIIGYLFVLLLVNLSLGYFILKGVPELTEMQSQWVATLTSVIPLILIFSYLDDYKNGTFGKRVAGLQVVYANDRFSRSLLRNIIKFLPWQLAHIGVIHGVYQDFDVPTIIVAHSGTFLGLCMLVMGLFRPDKCHLGDLFAGTKVELK